MNQIIKALIAILLLAMPSAQGAILAGPTTNSANGHIYFLLGQSDWASAEREANKLGGHLVTINDQEEQDWVYATFSAVGGTPRALWIGLTDEETEGTWVWANGEPFSYSNWSPGEPNNFSGRENYVMIFEPNDPAARGGLWNDADLLPTVGAPIHGVVEVVPRPGTLLSGGLEISTAVEISWPVTPGKYYQVEWTTEASPDAVWFNLGFPVKGVGQTNSAFDSTRTSAQRIYRVRELDAKP